VRPQVLAFVGRRVLAWEFAVALLTADAEWKLTWCKRFAAGSCLTITLVALCHSDGLLAIVKEAKVLAAHFDLETVALTAHTYYWSVIGVIVIVGYRARAVV
jgi:hypothetical protein